MQIFSEVSLFLLYTWGDNSQKLEKWWERLCSLGENGMGKDLNEKYEQILWREDCMNEMVNEHEGA